MNRRTTALAAGILAIAGLAAAALLYDRTSSGGGGLATQALVRPHSPVIGPADAPVTIVEFFDPSCEGCRAFYPYVKQILADYPDDVRLVIRYVLFHRGSEEAARLLEAAREQGLYVPVLGAVLAAQPQWHDDPQLAKAWEAAAAAGLDVDKARVQMSAPGITAILDQDMADASAVQVRMTPTFFVNGKPLPSFGTEPLRELVRSEVERAR